MRAVLTAALSLLVVLLAGPIPASAQDQALGGSFINPFPENDTYQVEVVGDWLADGLMNGLAETFATGSGVVVSKKRYDLPALMLNRTDSDLNALEQAFGNDPSHIAIVMLGAQDRYNVGSRRASGQGDWRNQYSARVDRLMKTLRKGGRAVYWVGVPNMRRWQDNERAQLMNDVFRERAYLNGVRYIDAYASFVDEGGGYSDFGPDVTGKVARLRDTDGVHFTDTGYRKLAHFVERDLRRDIAQAKEERSVPLAGDAAEQARVNPDRARLRAEAAPATPGGPAGQQKPKAKELSPAPAPDEAGREQKAETGKVDVKVAAPGGTEQIVSVDIVRPAIPASVVALVTRKQSPDKAAQMGDILVDQIPGGLTVMSSIVPPRGSDGRRRLSPTQTPYFRVFERGDRLPPKPGRADDFTWPRPQATAEVRIPEPPAEPPAKGKDKRR